MNRSQFLKTVADRAGAHKRDVEHVWEHALSVIRDSIRKGEKVGITGFGTFKQRVRKARPAGTAKNPFTGMTIRVAARPKTATPAFTAAKPLKEYVAGKGKAAKVETKPMALASNGARKAAPKKAAAAKKGAKKKTTARKGTKKTARRR